MDKAKANYDSNDFAVDLLSLFTPKPLDYYLTLVPPGEITLTVTLNNDECAALLKAHDHGLKAMSDSDTEILDRVVSTLKAEIRN